MSETNPYQEKKTTSVNAGVVIVVVGLVASFFLYVKPTDSESVYFVGSNVRLPGRCFSRNAFNLSCPGCGLTRSIVCISHGQWNRAAGFNLGGFAIYFGAVSFLIYTMGSRWISPEHFLHGSLFWTILIWIVLGLLIGQWIVRFCYAVLS